MTTRAPHLSAVSIYPGKEGLPSFMEPGAPVRSSREGVGLSTAAITKDGRIQLHLLLFPQDVAYLLDLANRLGLSQSASVMTILRELERHEPSASGDTPLWVAAIVLQRELRHAEEPKRLFRPPGISELPKSVSSLLQQARFAPGAATDSGARGAGPTESCSRGGRVRVEQLLAEALSDPALGFYEFVGTARAYRYLQSQRRSSWSLCLGQIRRLVQVGLTCQVRCADTIVARVLASLEASSVSGIRLDLGSLSRDIGLHRASLSRTLKAQLGMSFRQIANIVALRKAGLELANSDEQVAQIAYQLGYEYPSQLNARFRRFFGTSPTAFRALHRSLIVPPTTSTRPRTSQSRKQMALRRRSSSV